MTDSTGQDQTAAEERAQAILQQLKDVRALDLAYESVVGLLNFGTQKMGLHEETREIRDLDDARVSVELVRAILDVVEREAGDERARGLRDALAQMQLAYAHAVQLVGAEQAAGQEEPAPESEADGTGVSPDAPVGEDESAPGAKGDQAKKSAAEKKPGG